MFLFLCLTAVVILSCLAEIYLVQPLSYIVFFGLGGIVVYRDHRRFWGLSAPPVRVYAPAPPAPPVRVYVPVPPVCVYPPARVYPAYPENWAELSMAVKNRDGYCCCNCSSSSNLHVHHVVPLINGGTNHKTNLITLCKECHARLHPHMR
jgi:hypothetical protein